MTPRARSPTRRPAMTGTANGAQRTRSLVLHLVCVVVGRSSSYRSGSG
ncbi:hypothetical protein NKG94_05690 [Micromonospora sp. M12]